MSDIDLAAIVAEDAKTSGAVPAQEAPAPVDETAESTTAPADEAAEEQPTEAEGEQPQQKKPGGGFQKRISELTREKHEAKREAEQLRELLSKALNGQPQSVPQPAEQSEEPRREQFNTYEDFVSARAEYRADKRIEERLARFNQQTQAQTEEQAVQAKYLALEAKVLKQAQSDPEIGEAFEAAKKGLIPISPAVAEYVREVAADPGPLLKYLMNNDDVASQIAGLSKVAAGKELALVEARLSAKPRPKTSSAPPPPATVSGGAAVVQTIERMDHKSLMELTRSWDNR